MSRRTNSDLEGRVDVQLSESISERWTWSSTVLRRTKRYETYSGRCLVCKSRSAIFVFLVVARINFLGGRGDDDSWGNDVARGRDIAFGFGSRGRRQSCGDGSSRSSDGASHARGEGSWLGAHRLQLHDQTLELEIWTTIDGVDVVRAIRLGGFVLFALFDRPSGKVHGCGGL